ncbi:hypothetical protein EYC84_003242 [Monilinia fructicola]|uniref:Amine oxidase domain-containing protein n=1 Tax=Monilinia fructicola TaxID=38448 RepID=A0A5M9K164_MONFR|nr:hypothetical protein EYC84_003242 [Monilinia fructicola]
MASSNQRKHVVIIGAGAAGMACAGMLAQHPDKFKVTMIERMGVTGGQATSISLDKDKYGTDWMNDGVQGGSPIFKHTCELFKRYGHEAQGVKLQVAFGKGKDGFWTNCFPSPLVERFSSDIKKFGKVLQIIKWTMPVLGDQSPLRRHSTKLVMCVLADDALKILGRTATLKEKFVLGGAKFYDDNNNNPVIAPPLIQFPVTMFSHTNFITALTTTTSANTTKLNFLPRSVPHRNPKPKKTKSPSQKVRHPVSIMNPVVIDPCITRNPTRMTPQKSKCPLTAQTTNTNSVKTTPPRRAPIPYESTSSNPSSSTRSNRDSWTIDEIAPDKIIEKKWWHQLGHRWQHYAKVVRA